MTKLLHLNCPSCGANLEVEAGRKFCFCSYCGAKAILDDGSTTTHIVDEAKIREAEAMERIRVKEAEAMERIRLKEAEMQLQMQQLRNEEKKDKNDSVSSFFMMVGVIIMIIIMYGFVFYMKTHGYM